MFRGVDIIQYLYLSIERQCDFQNGITLDLFVTWGLFSTNTMWDSNIIQNGICISKWDKMTEPKAAGVLGRRLYTAQWHIVHILHIVHIVYIMHIVHMQRPGNQGSWPIYRSVLKTWSPVWSIWWTIVHSVLRWMNRSKLDHLFDELCSTCDFFWNCAQRVGSMKRSKLNHLFDEFGEQCEFYERWTDQNSITCLMNSVHIARVKKLLTEVVYWRELSGSEPVSPFRIFY